MYISTVTTSPPRHSTPEATVPSSSDLAGQWTDGYEEEFLGDQYRCPKHEGFVSPEQLTHAIASHDVNCKRLTYFAEHRHKGPDINADLADILKQNWHAKMAI